MSIEKVDIVEKLSKFTEHWKPYIIGELNGQYVKVVKFTGEFTWHHHDNEDEMFYVIKGKFDMQLPNRAIKIRKGQFIIIPRGIEHKPVALKEACVMLFEPASTLNTGNVRNSFTKENITRL